MHVETNDSIHLRLELRDWFYINIIDREYRNISRWRNIVECCSCAAAFYYFVQQNENRPKQHSCVVLIWRAMTEGDFQFRWYPLYPAFHPPFSNATLSFGLPLLAFHAKPTPVCTNGDQVLSSAYTCSPFSISFLLFFDGFTVPPVRCDFLFFFDIYRAWNILGQNIMNTYGTQRTQSTESRVHIFTQTSWQWQKQEKTQPSGEI